MSNRGRRGGLRRSSIPIPIEGTTSAAATANDAAATPRKSDALGTIGVASQETPYADLRQLAGLIHKPSTPQPRASSTGPPSTRQSARRTPSAQGRTPHGTGALRPAPSRRAVPTTPHTVRALQQRRAAAITPGRDRRRSGRGIRDSPRDVLRGLSRLLAEGTKPIEPSPQLEQSARRMTLPNDDLDVDPELPAPRFSLPLDDDDDDSFHLHPPRLSAPFEEESYTQQSVELPRRVNPEQSRLLRGSFGSIRTSDRFADINELDLGTLSEDGRDESLVRPGFDDYEGGSTEGEPENLDESTQDLRRTFHDETPRGQSDIIPVSVSEDQDDTTFVFSFPGRDRDVIGTSAFMLESGPEPEQLSFEPGQPLRELDRQSRGAAFAVANAESRPTKSRPKAKKTPKLSVHGIPYPSVPPQVVKKLASTFASDSGNGKATINKEALGAIMQASDWFFEQLSDDLGTYAQHARRKTIDETDMLTLMKRQRQVNATTTSFSLAQRYLPRELLQDIRMNPPAKIGRSRLRHSDAVDEQDDE